MLRTLIVSLAILLAISSLGGLLIPDMYARETGDWAAQSVAQDLFDLFFGVPSLLVAYYFYRKGSRLAFFMLAGILVFLIYTFVIYTLAVHFNRFFLLYCFTLALSVYGLIVLLWSTGAEAVKSWFDTTRTEKAAIGYLLFFAFLFYVLWLMEIIPALVSGQIPPNLILTGLVTNPVHVVDLSFLLPGFVITAVLLRKKHPIGYIMAPTIMAFSIIMTLSIATLIFYEHAKGFIPDYSVAFAMMFSSLVSVLILLNFMKRSEKRAA